MIISIAILLFARRVFSSLLVQGSISVFNKDTVTIDLHANKVSANELNAHKLSEDNLDELLEKLRDTLLNGQVHLTIEIGGKVIDVQQEMDVTAGRTADKRNYLENNYFDDFDRMTPINIKGSKYTVNYPTSVRILLWKRMIDNINDMLRRMALTREYDARNRKLSPENHPFNNDDRSFVPQGNQNSMILNEMFKQSKPLRASLNSKLAFEKAKRNSKSEFEIFLEYAQSVQDALSRLSRSLDAKRQDLNRIFNDIIKWKLSNLREQAQFFLESNFIGNGKHNEKTESKEHPPKGQSTKAVESIKSRGATTLNNTDKGNLHELDEAKFSTGSINASLNDIYNKTFNESTTNDPITPKVEMRILNYFGLLKNISGSKLISGLKPTDKNVTVESDAANRKASVKKSPRVAPDTSKRSTKVSNASIREFKKSIGNSNNSNQGIKVNELTLIPIESIRDNRNRFGQSRNTSTMLISSKIINNILRNNIFRRNDRQRQIGTRAMLQSLKSLKGNLTDKRYVSKSSPGKGIQVLTLRNKTRKEKDQQQQQQHVPATSHVIINYRNDSAKLQMKLSTIDKILEAVNGLLPTNAAHEKIDHEEN